MATNNWIKQPCGIGMNNKSGNNTKHQATEQYI